MTKQLKMVLSIAILIVTTCAQLAYAGRSQLENGYLVVPRIDVDGYGALELRFRLEVSGVAYFALEQASETSLSGSTSGVFDPVDMTIYLDEVEWEDTGDLYALELKWISQNDYNWFQVQESVHLNPDQAPGLDAFSQTTYPILRQHCVFCHAGSGPGSPSHASAVLQTAYDAVVINQKVNLASPDNSRLVQRLVTDQHFCWSDCATNGLEMRASIEEWASIVGDNSGSVSASILASQDRMFANGVEDVGGTRYTQGMIAQYEFKEGQGNVALDTSGVAPAMDLTLENDVEWLPNYGLTFSGGRAIASVDTSVKLYDRIAQGTSEYSIEAWVLPANTDQDGPARIVSYSEGTGDRNFTLGQVLTYYNFRNRSTAENIDVNGTPALETNNDEDDLQSALQHVVVTFDSVQGRRIYVNGLFTDDLDPETGGTLANWDPDFRFLLGNETTNNRDWFGQIRYVAVYDNTMPDAAILNNFGLGVGKKLRLRFDVSEYVPGTQLEFGVSELDNYSYLFCEPTVIGDNIDGLMVNNIRLEVNDQVPASGQAFTNVSAVVNSATPQLSRQCSVMPKEFGPDEDVFRVVFEVLGDFTNEVVVSNPSPVIDNSVADPLPLEGVRDFDRLNDTMAALTGVDPNSANVLASFSDIEQQLPADYDLRSFVSSHQVGVTKLALEYCDSMVESEALRDDFFGTAPSFGFDQPVATAFTPATTAIVTDALIDQMIGVDIATQPTPGEVAPVLDALIGDLTADCIAAPGGLSCDAARTRDVVKAACAAVLSSAAVLMH